MQGVNRSYELFHKSKQTFDEIQFYTVESSVEGIVVVRPTSTRETFHQNLIAKDRS